MIVYFSINQKLVIVVKSTLSIQYTTVPYVLARANLISSLKITSSIQEFLIAIK